MLRHRRNIEMDEINGMMNGICSLSGVCVTLCISKTDCFRFQRMNAGMCFRTKLDWIRHPVLHLHSYESMARIKRARKRNTKLQKDEASSEAFLLQLLGAA